MVTTAIIVDLGRATKVGEKYNQGFLQHPSHLKVSEKGGNATVEYGEETILHLRKVPPVCIPVVTTASGKVASGAKSLHDGNSRLDQTSGK